MVQFLPGTGKVLPLNPSSVGESTGDHIVQSDSSVVIISICLQQWETAEGLDGVTCGNGG